jgi:hypothetical protein
VDIQTLSITLAGIGIFIAAINSMISRRKADQQRQMELFTQLYDDIVSEQFAENFLRVMTHEFRDFDDYVEKRSNPDVPISAKLASVHRLIAYLCVTINKELIDIDLVDDLIVDPVIQYWEKIESFTNEARTRSQDYTIGYELEVAYKVLKRRKELEIAHALQLAS